MVLGLASSLLQTNNSADSLLQSLPSEVAGKHIDEPLRGCQTRSEGMDRFGCPLGSLCGLSLNFPRARMASSGGVIGFYTNEKNPRLCCFGDVVWQAKAMNTTKSMISSLLSEEEKKVLED